MRHRIWIAAIAAAALGAAGAVTAHAGGPPLSGSYSGGLTVKGTYKKSGATAAEKQFKFVDTSAFCNSTTTDFAIQFGLPTIRGSFDGKKIIASTSADPEQEIRNLLNLDSTNRGFNLVLAKTKGKGNFTKDDTHCVLKWLVKYSGDDNADGGNLPVKGKIKVKFVGNTAT